MIKSDLYLKGLYLNDSISYIFNKSIIEYDIESANTSICREYKLLPEKEILKLEKMKKEKRVIEIGKIMKKDKKFNEELSYSFIDIRKRFFDVNDIEDQDVLSIKKDAIFLLRKAKETNIGFCNFVDKNVYTSYMYLNRLELYFKSSLMNKDNSSLDIKGIRDEDLIPHKYYMIDFLKNVFLKAENNNQKEVLNYIKLFVSKYKKYELPVGYYREFDKAGKLINKELDIEFNDENNYPYETNSLDLSYNLFKIIAPLAKIILEK